MDFGIDGWEEQLVRLFWNRVKSFWNKGKKSWKCLKKLLSYNFLRSISIKPYLVSPRWSTRNHNKKWSRGDTLEELARDEFDKVKGWRFTPFHHWIKRVYKEAELYIKDSEWSDSATRNEYRHHLWFPFHKKEENQMPDHFRECTGWLQMPWPVMPEEKAGAVIPKGKSCTKHGAWSL